MGIDRVTLAARWGGVMGLVEDQQAARTEIAEPVHQRPLVGLVDEQTLGDEETGVGIPGIDAEAPLAADLLYVVLVQDLKQEAEAVV